jgi:hypothetical protein
MKCEIDELLSSRKVPERDELLPGEFMDKFDLGPVYQLGLAVPNVAEAARRLEAVGIGPFLIAEDDLNFWIERGEKKFFHGKLGMAYFGGYELELLEGGRGSTFYSEACRPDGAIVLHHVGILNRNLDDNVKKFNRAGIETAVRGRIKLGPFTGDFAYMDARKETGIYVEFIDYRLFGIPIRPASALMKTAARLLKLVGIAQLRMGRR